jgi:hypothetical protein
MSAWIVDKVHIDLLVSLALFPDRHGESPLRWFTRAQEAREKPAFTPDEIGRMLWQENLRSVAARYPGDGDGQRPGPTKFRDSHVRTYKHTEQPYQLTPAEGLQALACYEYQSCEHDGWEKSDAHRFCEILRSSLITRIPGYAEAPWGWTAKHVADRVAKVHAEIVDILRDK